VSQLYAVQMDVALPPDLDPARRADLLGEEKAYSQRCSGHWRHIWRCVGKYANVSIFDVEDNEQLHQILWGLPLFPYMTIIVTPLSAHPSDVTLDETGDATYGIGGVEPAPGCASDQATRRWTDDDPCR
jgi:muconolactone D-isomerase